MMTVEIMKKVVPGHPPFSSDRAGIHFPPSKEDIKGIAVPKSPLRRGIEGDGNSNDAIIGIQ